MLAIINQGSKGLCAHVWVWIVEVIMAKHNGLLFYITFTALAYLCLKPALWYKVLKSSHFIDTGMEIQQKSQTLYLRCQNRWVVELEYKTRHSDLHAVPRSSLSLHLTPHWWLKLGAGRMTVKHKGSRAEGGLMSLGQGLSGRACRKTGHQSKSFLSLPQRAL